MNKRATWCVVAAVAVLAAGWDQRSRGAEVTGPSQEQEAAAKAPGVPVETNSIGMKLVLIPAGEFMMGSGESAEELAKAYKDYGAPKADRFKDEYPQHRVRITKAFYLGVHEVTVGQFRQFVKDTGYKTDAEKGIVVRGGFGWNPDKKRFELNETYSWREVGFEQTDDHPVVNVSWNDAAAFCEWLGRKESKTYRLPTEAEWEYACLSWSTDFLQPQRVDTATPASTQQGYEKSMDHHSGYK